MARYLAQRLLLMIPVLWGVGTFVFILLRLLPGDALSTFIEESNNPAEIDALREEMGLNDPLLEQYLNWMAGAVRLDFGSSLLSSRSVQSELLDAIPVSAELALIATLVTLLVSVPGGIIAAAKQDTIWDHAARIFAILFLAVPNFWLGTMAFVLPAIWFGWIPPLQYRPFFDDPLTNLQQFLLPGIILGLGSAALGVRMMRSQMLEVLRQDFIRTGRAKGLRERTVTVRHAAPNALIPITALLGNEFARILGGTVILETIFGLPGVGRLTVDAISQRDYPQVEINVLFFALVFVVVNLLVDLTYGVLDPRVRHD